PWAQTAPRWLTRIRPAAWRRSARGSTGSPARAGQGRDAGGSPRVVSSARWTSTRTRSRGESWRAATDDMGEPPAWNGGLSAGPRASPSEAPPDAAPAAGVPGGLRRTARMRYHPASLLHPSQREAKFRPGNPVRNPPDQPSSPHEDLHRQVRDRPARLVSRRRL